MPCRYPTSFSSWAISSSNSTADSVSTLVFLLNLSLPFHTLWQLHQVVNTSDQSVQERCIPFKLHDHIKFSSKTGTHHCVFGIWGKQKQAEGLLPVPQGRQLDDRDLPCCEYETELQFCTCFLCSQGSRNLQGASHHKLHNHVSLYYSQHFLWVCHSQGPIMQNSLTVLPLQ